jgi:hypothetical protein
MNLAKFCTGIIICCTYGDLMLAESRHESAANSIHLYATWKNVSEYKLSPIRRCHSVYVHFAIMSCIVCVAVTPEVAWVTVTAGATVARHLH